jgi:hypothetical protein
MNEGFASVKALSVVIEISEKVVEPVFAIRRSEVVCEAIEKQMDGSHRIGNYLSRRHGDHGAKAANLAP